MKSLEEYKNNIIYEDLYNELCEENTINYTFTGIFPYIFEYYEIRKLKHVYNGCNELAEFIINKMKEHNPKNTEEKYILHFTKNELKNIPNIFFKELFIDVEISSNDIIPKANYEIWKNEIDEYKAFKYDEKEKLFNFINMSIIYGKFYTITSDILVHELTHAYEDYKLYSNTTDDTLYNKLIKTDYIDNILKLSSKIDSYERFIRNIEYILNPHEQNAFIAQIVSIINTKCKSISGENIKQLYDYIYNHNKLFISFNSIYHNFKYFINHANEFNLLAKKYNIIYNTNYSKEKIYSKLSKDIYSFKKKLIKAILDTWSEFKYDDVVF